MSDDSADGDGDDGAGGGVASRNFTYKYKESIILHPLLYWRSHQTVKPSSNHKVASTIAIPTFGGWGNRVVSVVGIVWTRLHTPRGVDDRGASTATLILFVLSADFPV